MTVRKRSLVHSSPRPGTVRVVKSRVRKLPWTDPDEITDLSDVPIDQFKAYVNGKPVKLGRPFLENPKKAVTIRLDADLVDHFRASGSGWQTRVNALLRKAAKI